MTETANTTAQFQSLKTDFHTMDNWFYKKRNIGLQIDETGLTIHSKKRKAAYLSLYERNANFKKRPQAKQIKLAEEFHLNLIGTVTNDVKVTLYLIEYDAQGRNVQTNRVFLNKPVDMKLQANTANMRFAIRLFGEGVVKITDVVMHAVGKRQLNLETKQPQRIRDLKMACIFDEFSMQSFQDEVSLVSFTPENWREVFEQENPDLLMVESAWQGNFGTWRHQIASFNVNKNYEKLREVIRYCNEAGIPTVFWNKEDPIHFKAFIEAASLFDYIFTTDANVIPDYKERVGHDNVFALQFAANPLEHNPIMVEKRKKNKISFAGSYYGNRHPDRRRDMDEMLRITKQFGLHIYDRNYEVNKAGKTDFSFPEDLQENVVGTLKYNQINQAYKGYKLILNVNSVKDSPTMFSRRVFEGLACGTPIVSSYSQGIQETFGDIVAISEDADELKSQINEWMNDEKAYRDVAMKGIREIFRHHTYEKRMQYILTKLNMPFVQEENKITAVVVVDSLAEFQQAEQMINRQSLPDVHLLALVGEFAGREELLEKYTTDSLRAYPKEEALNDDSVQELVSTAYVTVLSLEPEYGEYYLEDLMHAANYSQADIIGKKSLFDGSDYHYAAFEYEYVDSVIKETAIYKVACLSKVDVQALLTDDDLINKLFTGTGAKIFSGDQFSMNRSL